MNKNFLQRLLSVPFAPAPAVRPLWQFNGLIGFIVISLAMPFTLTDDCCIVWLLPPALAFLWLIFSIDKGSCGSELGAVLQFRKLQPGQPAAIAAAFVAALVLCYAAGVLSETLMDLLGIETPKEQPLVEALKNSSLAGKILIGILVSFFAPLGEEIAFRRLLFGLLRPRGIWFAILLTSLIFAILHFYLKGFLSLFMLALILQLLYIKTGNLWTSVQVHAFFNLLTFLSALLSKAD